MTGSSQPRILSQWRGSPARIAVLVAGSDQSRILSSLPGLTSLECCPNGKVRPAHNAVLKAEPDQPRVSFCPTDRMSVWPTWNAIVLAEI